MEDTLMVKNPMTFNLTQSRGRQTYTLYNCMLWFTNWRHFV